MSETGLRQAEIMDYVIELVMRVEKTWLQPGTPVQRRVDLLVACVFKGLDKLGLPHPQVKNDTSLGTTSGLYTGGVGDGAFVLRINPGTSEWKANGPDRELDLRECLDTVYHETRHHEQYLRAVEKFIWVNNKDFMVGQLRNAKTRGGSLKQIFMEKMSMTAGVASYYEQRKLARKEYQGMELEEANKWYEEAFGKHSAEQSLVMDDFGAHGNRRATYYSLYRTLFMEDDGWEAGYAAGDAYMKRALIEKAGRIKEAEQLIEARKAKLSESTEAVRTWAAQAKRNGASDDAILNKVKQARAKLVRGGCRSRTKPSGSTPLMRTSANAPGK
jgi:hypothetical protein